MITQAEAQYERVKRRVINKNNDRIHTPPVINGNPVIFTKQYTDHSVLASEALALRTLKHDNVVAIANANPTHEYVDHLPLEYVFGSSFSTFENSLKTKELTEKIFNECLQGLDFIHNQFIVHANITPNNIIIKTYRGQMRPVFVDFSFSFYCGHHYFSAFKRDITASTGS